MQARWRWRRKPRTCSATAPAAQRRRLDVRGFNQVLSVKQNFVEAEGMMPYEALTSACLAQGVMPAVVPQLKTITLGGAVAGVGIESSSHRYGLVHDTMLEIDVLLGDGRVVELHRRQRALGSLLRLPEFLRHARLRAAREGEDHPGEEVRAPLAFAVHRCLKLFFRAGKTARCRRCRLRRRHGVLARRRCSSRSAASPIRRLTPAITPTRTSTTARSPRSATIT